MFYSTRSKLILSFLGVSILVGVVSLFVGSQLLYQTVLNEATTRISLDLNAAREIYLFRIKTIQTALNIATLDNDFRSSLYQRTTENLIRKLKNIAQQAALDFAGITTGDGYLICRIGPNALPDRPARLQNPIINYVTKRGTAVAGTVVFDSSSLAEENPELARQAKIPVLPTPMSAQHTEKEETSGMALAAGIPIYENNELIGILYGGILLNRSKEIVDTVRETVFKHETYRGRSVGTATIFFKDLRISTNVIMPDGNRALGTQVSKEVRDRVLIGGERWTKRAFVVSDWYITAYEPILDIFGERVGILYVGVLEGKYKEVRRNVLSVFILITVTGVIVAIGLGYIMANKITHPVRQLIQASREVSLGTLMPNIGPPSRSELGILQKTFREMLASLQERYKKQRDESEYKLLLSEKQASIGRLAAGVAHEINNPLTGVLTFTHMLLRRDDLDEEARSDLTTIANETERVRKIVKGLLDFSRQTKLDQVPTDINKLVKETINLVENQALVKGIRLVFEPVEDLPVRTVDPSQLQCVMLNIIINALDATEPGKTVTVKTGIGVSTSKTEQRGIEIEVSDEGCGIPPENLDKLFDPFFTTKEVGQGTGLGLAVSYGIIERHGGTIYVHSEVGKGSSFTIWLPLEEGKGED